jgi:hypothetical protein
MPLWAHCIHKLDDKQEHVACRMMTEHKNCKTVVVVDVTILVKAEVLIKV